MRGRWALIAVGVLALAVARPLAAPRAAQEEAARGRTDYLRYCASCHGTTGDGRGPVASVLRRPPADLRRLGERYGTPLPSDRIVAFIDGRERVAAHGERDMPVWGERFDSIEINGRTPDEAVRERLTALLAYLRTIQRRGE